MFRYMQKLYSFLSPQFKFENNLLGFFRKKREASIARYIITYPNATLKMRQSVVLLIQKILKKHKFSQIKLSTSQNYFLYIGCLGILL